MHWRKRKALEEQADAETLRAVSAHEIGHALTAAILVSPSIVKRVRINDDGTGFCEFTNQKISRNGNRIISAGGWAGESALGLGTRSCASKDDRSYFDSVEQWAEALSTAELLLVNHRGAFAALVDALLEHREIPGIMIEVALKEEKRRQSPASRTREEGELRYRTTLWQYPVLAR
jgi:hypothetical protein